ncbi:Hypothetical predicted protein [Mytilus galloprovincialis]|uniref:Uncharacterized protein n=1 Tax=Mytilus galloprovincialis TaxID=29158 RepID=A0A8B6EM01_MYTGA|nr:Hypothetical predicted protein [Mytilus galloprovincialis]
MTRRRTVEANAIKHQQTWATLQKTNNDRRKWKIFVTALHTPMAYKGSTLLQSCQITQQTANRVLLNNSARLLQSCQITHDLATELQIISRLLKSCLNISAAATELLNTSTDATKLQNNSADCYRVAKTQRLLQELPNNSTTATECK